MGIDMIEGGGKLFAGSRGRHVGPGHFGLLDLGQGVQKFSLHYEADLDRGGVSVLDIRPLLWRDGWPVAGDNLVADTYAIESARTGTVLELAVQGLPVGGFRCRACRRQRSAAGAAGDHLSPIRSAAQVSRALAASADVRLAPAMLQAQQKWTIAPVANAGAIQARRTSGSGLKERSERWRPPPVVNSTAVGFSGAPEQLWRIDQLTDGSIPH